MSRKSPVWVRSLFAIACWVSCISTPISASRSDVAAICESAAALASRESGVPVDVLRAISLTETGRKANGSFQPWPWTVNMEGVGKWFDDVSSAKAYVDMHYARGARSFDVGCFQINYKWHGRAFASIEAMFDPITNARYAAKFLGELYAEFGNWSQAAGAYHSRTPKYAKRYTGRFDRIRANLPAVPEAPSEVMVAAAMQAPTAPPRENNYPLLVSREPNRGPSLVPLRSQSSSLFSARTVAPFFEFR